MGLFDLFKRKPPPPPVPEVDEESSSPGDGPSPHYALAHYALRFIALGDPLRFLGIVASPDAQQFIAAVMKDVAEKCGRTPAFRPHEVKIHPTRVGIFPCAVIEFPEPKEVAEAYFTALVVPVDTSGEMPDDESQLKGRYFTLEKGMTFGGGSRTVLAEWNEDTHFNCGDGPPPNVAAFVAALTKLMAGGPA